MSRDPLLAEIRRLAGTTPCNQNETLALLDSVISLRRRLALAHSAIGRELRALDGGLTAAEAYARTKRRPS
jgi:hypothetical protein